MVVKEVKHVNDNRRFFTIDLRENGTVAAACSRLTLTVPSARAGQMDGEKVEAQGLPFLVSRVPKVRPDHIWGSNSIYQQTHSLSQ